ncbi:MAG: type II secretion system major pseudopilin GspG [Opitutaceae bacterium]|nr:type II secretion system major pseudopilin GspG [Opitutaceae bacterium]
MKTTRLPSSPSRRRAQRGRVLRSSASRSEAGFTLVELLLVLVILGILAALVLPKFTGRTEQARITAAQTQMASFGTALDAFEVDTGSYPRGNDGLNMLLVAPADVTGWRGPYLKDAIPLDPWGRPYLYEFPGKVNPTGYDIRSAGPDGNPGTEDDIVNAKTAAK